MAKGYWVTFYRTVSHPDALAEYGKAAVPAIEAYGGRFLSRGTAIKAFEVGLKERSLIVELESAAKAIECYESPTYQSALKILAGTVERDIRILEGVS